MLRLSVLGLLSCGVACGLNPLPLTPLTFRTPADAQVYWPLAQQLLAERYGRPEAHSVGPGIVRHWIARRGVFRCGETDGVSGCWEQGLKRLQWNVERPGVICHEAGHAIMYALGDPRARTVGHPGSPSMSCDHELGGK